MSKPVVNIDNDSYVKSHGKNPSGFGSWGFEIIDAGTGKVEGVVFAPFSDTLTGAKKWVAGYVREHLADELATGLLVVSVAP